MSRWEFMRRLEELLSDISPSEKEEALQYYNDYFNDAGKEKEGEVMGALGSPEQVAAIVREGLSDGGSLGEFTENGFSRASFIEKNAVIKKQVMPNQSLESDTDINQAKKALASGIKKESQGENQTGNQNAGENHNAYSNAPTYAPKEKKDNLQGWAIALIIIGCILLSPAILGLLVAGVGIILSILLAIFGVILAFGGVTVLLFVLAVALGIGGFSCLLLAPLEGVGMIGGALICAAVGILFLLITVFLAGYCIPGIFKGIAYIFRSIFGKKGGTNA